MTELLEQLTRTKSGKTMEVDAVEDLLNSFDEESHSIALVTRYPDYGKLVVLHTLDWNREPKPGHFIMSFTTKENSTFFLEPFDGFMQWCVERFQWKPLEVLNYDERKE